MDRDPCPEGSSIPTESLSSRADDSKRPGHITIGSGSTSEAAARLMSMLDHDSGYGGSLVNGETTDRSWHPTIVEDRPSASPTLLSRAGSTEQDRHHGHVLQLRYNQNKNALARSIHGTIHTLKNLQERNSKWPVHYQSIPVELRPAPANPHTASRPGLHHTQSALDYPGPLNIAPDFVRTPRRTLTSIPTDFGTEETNSASAPQDSRLVSPGFSHGFSVLNLELRMGGRAQTDLLHSLGKGSIASLLDGQIQQSIRYLCSIKERIEDTSSKVLVTGDLNAGKSTFCNALLRRKILPEDQQPCTSIFCEVLDFRENASIEEVHAIPIGSLYNRHDESTYTIFDLSDLAMIVIDNTRFEQCKIYVKDNRSVDESLLNNGVVDISLIDAPGLNADSLKTTAVFARQEEIDVIVFVISAANHFTESAKNFIASAVREKTYIFMVVNGFDTIRDQQRCKETILKQVYSLSPATFKESSELVHFVSSNAIPTIASSQDGSPPDDDDDGHDPSDKGKGKETEKTRDFEDLETSLRRFVLEKRARSKLAPAKTYLLNVLGDIRNLSTINQDIAQSEFERVKKELDVLEPKFNESEKAKTEGEESVERVVEDTASDAYNYTRDTLNNCILTIRERDLGIEYPGIFSAYQYAEDIRDSMLHEITQTLHTCEEKTREQTVQGYNSIKNLGILHLGNSLHANIVFRSERMFRKPTHVLARHVDIEIELSDFLTVASLWERQEKAASTGLAMTIAGVVGGRFVGGVGWLDGALGAVKVVGLSNLRKLIIPGLIAGVAVGVLYIAASVPKSLPYRLSAKLSAQLAAINYTHSNALRLSSEVRRALKGPANDVSIGLQRNVERLQLKKEETGKIKAETSDAKKYFANLFRQSSELQQMVRHIDLEATPPAVVNVNN